MQYVPDLRVRHLEIEGVRQHYRKLFSYGRSMRRLKGSRGRVLRVRERLDVCQSTIRAERLSAPRAAALVLALSGGAVCWTLGSLRGVVPGEPRT